MSGRWLLLCALGSAALSLGRAQQVRGTVVDRAWGAIGGATVRLLNPASEEVAHVTANEAGKFQIQIVGPGEYILRASHPGFRSRRVTVVLRSVGQALDVGDIQLNIASCDAPGVICDSFGDAPPPDPIASSGNLQIRTGCGVAFVMNAVLCPGDPARGAEDIRLTRSESGVYLTALNGATFVPPDPSSGDCSDAHPKENQIRIDGLGVGDDICLYTRDRHWAHVFFTDEVRRRDARPVAIWQITRSR
ncbi:MAG: carboxypeptidase-like regulatory domain-containing protein [Bryobacteraceae bacterium]